MCTRSRSKVGGVKRAGREGGYSGSKRGKCGERKGERRGREQKSVCSFELWDDSTACGCAFVCVFVYVCVYHRQKNRASQEERREENVERLHRYGLHQSISSLCAERTTATQKSSADVRTSYRTTHFAEAERRSDAERGRKQRESNKGVGNGRHCRDLDHRRRSDSRCCLRASAK